MPEKTLDVSWETIIKFFIASFIFYIIYLARDIAVWFFFALVISILLQPAVNFLRRIYIPKIIAIFLIYLSIFGLLSFLVYLTAPIFVYEIKQFVQSLPDYFERISPLLKQLGFDVAKGFGEITSILTGNLEKSSKSVIGALLAFFGGLASTVFILTIAFFLSLEEKGVEKFLILLSPKKYEEHITTLFKRAQNKVAGWFGARILACLFVGVASFIVFYIFGVKYAFLLALLAGILNFVPYVGPWITSILLIVFVISFSASWFFVFYVLAAFLLIQLIENSLLTPILMKKMIDLPPVLVLLALLVGSQIFGFLGTIFAVPVFGIIYEFLKEFLEQKREGEM
ncbi:MAG: AI-2E family transporter [Candidatus Staskawiczbacteria bacterium]|nr:AI-2E family transporter [Candidatus Staskawiczbacteria bacterium]MBI3337640.1 AI-2E family transporter [Candidatus Staskawiczbacteria bacterium]